MNQLLHITLRRSRSDEHALTLLIKELDKYMEIASPTRSIVLAFDGPPPAAKLATQRRRRLNTVVRAERKKIRLEILKKRGLLVPHQKEMSRRKNKAVKEEETLKITPGTEFMEKAHDAVLYWAWQRLDSPRGRISQCRIYICPSTVPGEGEVKLLDWLLQAGSDQVQRRRSYSSG
jgi:5'-3' exonuclease